MATSKSSAAAVVAGLLKALGTAMVAASALALDHRCSHRQVVSERQSQREKISKHERELRKYRREMRTGGLRNAQASSEQGR